MQHKEYNGWYNYETWNVNLWLDNEQGTQEAIRQAATDALYNANGDQDEATASLAKDIETDVTDNMIPDLGCTMAADLLNGALSEVNWHEIAEHAIADAAEEYEREAREEQEREALENANVELEALEQDETGACDACNVAIINGVRCHEGGCPRYQKLVRARHLVETLENA